MAEFTFLKLQFDDASFTANAPLSGDGEAEVDVEADSEDEESMGILPVVVGLVFLIVVAVVVKKYMGGDDGPEPPEE